VVKTPRTRSELHPIGVSRIDRVEWLIVSIRWLRNTLTVAAAMTLVGTAMAEARVVSPTIDETVHSNTGSIRVIVEGVPGGLQLQPVLDGEAMSEPIADSVFYLRGVTRGTHELTVKLLDAGGQEVIRTSPVTFHVWHASRLFRHRQR
jgi:hypothetical protein